MNAKIMNLLNILRCPHCNCSLQLYEGGVRCDNHHLFPVDGNVITFVTSSEFDVHWMEYELTAVSQQKLKKAKEFLTPITKAIESDPKRQFTLLDVGCGDGVHAEHLVRYANLTYIGVDISSVVYENDIRFRNDTNAIFIRCDAMSLPFRLSTFNFIISFGAINYTADPRKVLSQLPLYLCQGGTLLLWVAPEKKGIARLSFYLVRLLYSFLSVRAKKVLNYALTPLLFTVPTKSGINLRNSSVRECAEIISINLEPKDLILMSEGQLLQALSESCLSVIQFDDNNRVTLYAQR